MPEEAITSNTREPSYVFLAAEWNRSTVSERAYLLAMLFGREFGQVRSLLDKRVGAAVTVARVAGALRAVKSRSISSRIALN